MSLPITPSNSGQLVNTIPTSPSVLKEGQMFHGQIKQLFPGQTAEVQIGNQKLIAKLEIPMKAGDSYYFQVKSVEPDLQLKIISGPLQGSEGQGKQLAGLMDAMKLPKTPEMQALLTFVMQNKIPMSRENLLEAAALLKSVPTEFRAEALQVIQKLTELKLPLNENYFRSLLGVETKEGLHSILNELKSALAKDSSLPIDLKATILSTLANAAKPFAQATSVALLGQTILTLLDRSEAAENRFTALQSLKNTGLLPQHASLANLQQILAPSANLNQSPAAMGNIGNLAQASNETNPNSQQLMNMLKELTSSAQSGKGIPYENLKVAIQADTLLTASQKTDMIAIVERTETSPQKPDNLPKLITDLNQLLIRQTAQTISSMPFQNSIESEAPLARMLALVGQVQEPQPEIMEKLNQFLKIAENSGNPVVAKLLQSAEVAVSAAVDGKAMKEALQLVFRELGFNYEAGLLGKESDLGRLSEALKPQLLNLLQNHALNPAMRDAAETVVMRLNGPMLQSGENGVQHQLIMQVPLDFFGKRIDTTLEWNGRKSADGKLDSDYARIMFYLELEAIDKTVIDMQVQNRVVSITIFNENESLRTLGVPLQNKLKEGLEAVGYKLSGVFFKKFAEQVQKVVKKESIQTTEGKGVDFRI